MTHSRQNKRQSAQKWNNRLAMITITAVVISLAVVVNIKVSSLKQKEAIYQQKVERYTEDIEKEQERSQKLENERIYVQTKQYIEQQAREKLGLVDPDEILLKPSQ